MDNSTDPNKADYKETQDAISRAVADMIWRVHIQHPEFWKYQLQHLYELVLERPLDKRNFRKRVLAMDLLIETDEVQQDVAHRAARLYRFDERKYARLAKAGFNFEL